MTKTWFFGVVILAVSACQSAAPPDPIGGGPTSDGTEGITMRVATPDRLAGGYVDPAGVRIDFETARTGDALYLDLSTGTGHELIHAETTATTYEFRYLDRR